MLSVAPTIHSETSANGTASGSDSRMVIGCRKLSNWLASTMYMKMTDSRKASWKPGHASRCSSLPMPVTPVR